VSSADVPSADSDKAGSRGSLSVPPSWTKTVPQSEPESPPLPDSGETADPAVAAGSPPWRTFQGALMGMMTGHRPTTHTTDRNNGEKDDNDDEAQYAATTAQDATAIYDAAGAASAAGTLTPVNEPQATGPAEQDARARALGQTADTDVDLDAAGVPADSTTVIPVEPGYTGTAPPCSTITLGTSNLETSTQMDVNRGLIAVDGASTTVKNAVGPLTINVGSTATSLTKCHEGATVIRAGTRLTATSSPITLTQYGDTAVVVQLVSGSATVTGTGTPTAQVITPPGHIATATVGAAGGAVTNIKGTVTISTVTPAPRSSRASRGRHRREEDF
jgi:hypothetical protein